MAANLEGHGGAQVTDSILDTLPDAEIKFESDLNLVSVADLFDIQPKPPAFLIDGLLPERVVTLLGAHGGTGKTMLGLIAAVCLATGSAFMGKPARRARVVFYSGEDPAQVLRWRLAQICREYALDPRELDGWLTVIDATEGDPTLYTEILDGGTRHGITTHAYNSLRAISESGAEVFVIDNASDAYDADENQRARVRGFIRSLAHLVKQQAGAVLLLAHVDKSTAKGFGGSEGYSGSTAWHNSVRSRLFMSEDDSGLLLEHQKSNLGKKSDPIRMEWSERGVLVLANAAGDCLGLIASAHRVAVIQMLAEFYDRGEFIPTSPNAAGNAYRQLKDEHSFPARMKSGDFYRLLRDIERSGFIERETYKNASRHDRERWRVTEAGRRFATGAPSARQVEPVTPSAQARQVRQVLGGYGGESARIYTAQVGNEREAKSCL